MKKILLPLAALSTAVLLAAGARGQSGRKVQAVDLRPLSVTQIVEVREFSRGKEVSSKRFTYELYFKDDGTPDTLSPVVSSVKLKNASVHHLDRVVKSDPWADMLWLYDGDEGLTPLRGYVVTDPATGRPDHKVGGAVLADKNGRPVVLSLRVLYRDWRKRKVTVTELPDNEQ